MVARQDRRLSELVIYTAWFSNLKLLGPPVAQKGPMEQVSGTSPFHCAM